MSPRSVRSGNRSCMRDTAFSYNSPVVSYRAVAFTCTPCKPDHAVNATCGSVCRFCTVFPMKKSNKTIWSSCISTTDTGTTLLSASPLVAKAIAWALVIVSEISLLNILCYLLRRDYLLAIFLRTICCAAFMLC